MHQWSRNWIEILETLADELPKLKQESNTVSWRWCFYINLPIGALSASIILLFSKTPSAAKPKSASLREKLLLMDLVGVVLVMGAVISYMLALHYGGQTYAWNSYQVGGLLVGFVILSAAFLWCGSGARRTGRWCRYV